MIGLAQVDAPQRFITDVRVKLSYSCAVLGLLVSIRPSSCIVPGIPATLPTQSTIMEAHASSLHHTCCRLRSLGLSPATKADLPPGRKFPFVAFSAPPSGSTDYQAEVGGSEHGACSFRIKYDLWAWI